jgi:hypothetical protein
LWIRVRPGNYPRVEHLKVISLGLGLTLKHETRLERLFMDKHLSLQGTLINYELRKKFYNIGPDVRGHEKGMWLGAKK